MYFDEVNDDDFRALCAEDDDRLEALEPGNRLLYPEVSEATRLRIRAELAETRESLRLRGVIV